MDKHDNKQQDCIVWIRWDFYQDNLVSLATDRRWRFLYLLSNRS